MINDTFKKELEQLINRHSIESDSDTPDYMLAEYILRCLEAYAQIVMARDTWYSFDPGEKICYTNDKVAQSSVDEGSVK